VGSPPSAEADAPSNTNNKTLLKHALSADERRRWAIRDFRAVVAVVLYGDEPRRVTIEEADQAIGNIETRERVW
jgi:hypothetical protein